MRFYRIELQNPTTLKPILPQSLGGMEISSLTPDGQFNPGALNIELDIPVSAMGMPESGVQTLCRIWNLGLQDLGGAFNLAPTIKTDSVPARDGANITIYGGMSKGLPLAKPSQQGPLVKGTVYNAYGNWVGTDMTVDLILSASIGSPGAPLNIVLNWEAGQQLSDALRATLKVAFPNVPVRIAISPNLSLNHDQNGFYHSLDELSEVVQGLTMSIVNRADYKGVSISDNGTNITITDGTVKPKAKMILFEDLLGQPTWGGEPGTVQAKFVMRGDLAVNDIVTLPRSLVTTTAGAFLNFFDKTQFSGNYLITDLHHYGNFRQPDGESWNTTVNMVPEPIDSSSAPSKTTGAAAGGGGVA